MEKRSELSAALRHPLGTVWPSVDTRHQRHLMARSTPSNGMLIFGRKDCASVDSRRDGRGEDDSFKCR